MSAEAGLHCHDQDEIDVLEKRKDRICGCAGIEHNTALAAELTYFSESREVIVVRLDVDADEVGPGFREGFHIAVRFREHEMGVEKHLVSRIAKGRNRCWTKGEIRDEVAVHNIHVKPFEAKRFNGAGARGEIGVIAGQ